MPKTLIVSLAAFFLITSFFSWNRTDGHFNSPDETANYFFIEQFAKHGSLRVATPINEFGERLVHPRSMTVVGTDIAPGSFLGLMLLYGSIAAVAGMWIVPFLTPLFATLASAAWYGMTNYLFSEKIARVSTALLLIMPAWLYYTSRGLFPNVPFVAFLLFGFWFLTRQRWNCAGFMIGIALAIRTSEAMWVGALLVIVWFFARHVTPKLAPLRVAIFAALPFIPIAIMNTATYGHPLQTGYAQAEGVAIPGAFSSSMPLAPFGIDLLMMIANAWTYLVVHAWWFSIPAVLGIAIVVRTVHAEYRRPHIAVGGIALVAIFLIVYYGSWQFVDSTLSGPTIGNSFVRYWLPISVLGVPFAAIALERLRRLRVPVYGGIVVLSIWLVFFGNTEALQPVTKQLLVNNDIRSAIVAVTEPNAVIVTDVYDKVLFPERQVIVDDSADRGKMDRVIATLAQEVPVYSFMPLTETDIAYINMYRLAPYEVAWEKRADISDASLLRLIRTP
jgi:hypothetical protein